MAARKTIRVTLDVDPEFHFQLGAWLAAAYPIVGGRVPTTVVIRALLTELLTDDAYASKADAKFTETLRTRVLDQVKAHNEEKAQR